LNELEKNWIQALDSIRKTEDHQISMLVKLLKRDPDRACLEAQSMATKLRKKDQ